MPGQVGFGSVALLLNSAMQAKKMPGPSVGLIKSVFGRWGLTRIRHETPLLHKLSGVGDLGSLLASLQIYSL